MIPRLYLVIAEDGWQFAKEVKRGKEGRGCKLIYLQLEPAEWGGLQIQNTQIHKYANTQTPFNR